MNPPASTRHFTLATALRVILPVTLTVILFFVGIFLVLLPAFERSLVDRKRALIRELTNNAISLLDEYERRARLGELSADEARARALERIRHLRYGKENRDYYWVTDLTPVLLAHPYRRDLEGQDVSTYRDPDGKRLFVDMVEQVQRQKEGYVDYMWQWKDDPNRVVPKVSFVKLFEPWGWVVGTGMYVEDVRAEIGAISARIVKTCAGLLAVIVLLSGFAVWQGLRTEHLRAHWERALRKSESRHRAIFENIQDIYYEVTIEGELLVVSPSIANFSGYQPEDLIGRRMEEFYADPGERQRFLERIQRDGAVSDYDIRLRDRDGAVRFCSITASIRQADSAGPARICGSMRDISGRVKTERALRQLEQIVSSSSVIVFLWRAEEGWPVEFVSDNIRLFGYRPGQFLNGEIDFVRIIHPDDIDRVIEEVRRHTEAGATEFEQRYRIVTADGQTRWTVDRTWIRRDDAGHVTHYQGILEDVTERREAEEERLRLATAIHQAAEGVVITDVQGVIQYVNPAFEAMTGYGRPEVLGRTPEFLDSGKNDAPTFADAFARLKSEQTWKGRFINRNKNGAFFEVESTISPVRDRSGRVVNYVAVSRDVTREAKLEAHLRQAQKMEAVGVLAGGIAHDFNNILQAITGYCEVIRDHVGAEPTALSCLDEVDRASRRAIELVRQILAFSRQTDQRKRPMELQHVVKEALKLLRGALPSTVEIRPTIDPDCAPVLADATQIHQVVMNLATNACHAMRERGGLLEVVLEEVNTGPEAEGAEFDAPAGRYVCLTVRDTGHGMDEETRKRIFEPYFSTKEVGQGSGLGLATVHGIVRSHDGVILVDSQPGVGTTARVFFPVCLDRKAAVDSDKDDRSGNALPTGVERVLFVDDEAPIARLGEQLLGRLGYRVTSCSNSVDALALFREKPDRFDVVVTDLTMPNLPGDELSRMLLGIRPSLPIIMCTGYSEVFSKERAREIGVRQYVMKPIVAADLARAIRRAVDGEDDAETDGANGIAAT